MDSIHLDGAETVSNAARTMRAAGEEMSQAAMNFDGALERHQRFLDDWLQRFETVVEKLQPPVLDIDALALPGELAQPVVKQCDEGDHPAGSDGDKCFACFAHNMEKDQADGEIDGG